ncbi:penicillin-binding protein 2 [Segetibacter sp. 3557_3]|uniref:penicillin-binding protein 2 n=1 Tax=Segetibacter sp. 3557_3 TaxID=2547429 RepID=UPI001058B920|nr:penicillin-binding protein 2 [Segetibacter sp. 3557_3]TDH23258.1 penicillin-binding protein 2 [Segetibacter sp. 3557_3]
MPVFNQSRSRVIQLIFIIVFLVIVGQLFNLQILSSKYTELALDNAVAKKIVYPSRGIIYDRKHRAILDNISKFDFIVTPNQVKGIDTFSLCTILGIDTTEFRKRIVNCITKNGRYRPSVFEPLVSPQVQAQLDENMYKFPGFYLSERPIRSYPYKVAAHVLGYVGEVDTTIIRKSGNFYQMGDYVGRTGLEASYEKVLMGQRGVKFLIKDNKNRIQGPYEGGVLDTASLAGRNLYSSLDIELQQLAEQLMNSKIGGLVAINPKTGGILAMASGPSFDPNDLAGAMFRKNYGRMVMDTARPLYNRAIKGQYPPGSTFKPIGGLIALDEGLITPAYGYPCGGAYYACSRAVKCTHAGHGHAATLRAAIANSCNSYFVNVFRMAIDNPKYQSPHKGYLKWKEYMNAFGLGVRLGVDLPSEDRASVPDTSGYNRDYGNPNWNSCFMQTLGIGQDRMTATPIQMANAMCIIANKGYYYTPHFVDSIQGESAEDTVLAKYRIKHSPLHISDDSYEAIHAGMNDVTVYGTAVSAKIDGIDLCAKTGTAQNPHGKNHSIFVAFAPRQDPKIAMAVVVENSGYGGTWAGPITSLMIEKYLNDTIAEKRKPLLKRISEADLIPSAIKHWYYVKDSLRRVRLAKEVNENTPIEASPVVPRKTTFDPDAEPNRRDTGSGEDPRKFYMNLPGEIRVKKDTAKL